jgi:hypothetical protein
LVEDFWLAIARNDREGAEAAVASIEPPLVALLLTYSFKMVDKEEQETDQGRKGALPKSSAVMPDTPLSTVDAWNAEVPVALVVVSKSLTCGARISDGEVDFLACAGATERPGLGGCGWTTHELGGKDSKKRRVVKMELLEQGEAFAISVKSSGGKVQRPKNFLLPILRRAELPYPETIEWDIPLLSLKFRVRDWKFVIEVYPGAEQLARAYSRSGGDAPEHPPLRVEIPLGGPSHTEELIPPSEEVEPVASSPGGLSGLFAARASRSSQSVQSGKESQPGASPAPGLNLRLTPIYKRIQALETRTATLEDSLPGSFGLVRDEMNLIWKDMEDLCENFAAAPTVVQPRALYQARGADSRGGSLPSLSGPAFQQLISQVVDKLRSSGFMLQSDLDDRFNAGLPANVIDQISGLSRRVSKIEKNFSDPEGTLAKLEGRIKALEDQRAGDAIECGGKTFRDVGAVAAWLQTFSDKNLF